MVCAAPVADLRAEAMVVPQSGPVYATRGGLVGALRVVRSPRFTLRYGRCREHRVRGAKVTGMIAGLGVVVGLVGGTAAVLSNNGRLGLGTGAIAVLFVASVAALIWALLADLRIDRADDGKVWIAGFGAPYLALLPEHRPTRVVRGRAG